VIKLLTFSTLYPSSVRPSHGIFVETRLRHLLASGEVQSVAVAPVPWFPLKGERFGDYSKYARTPREETRNGIRVLHPRFPLVPKFGMTSAPALLAAAALPTLRRLIREGYDFDVIDAHYFYPDGVAAAILAKQLNKPFVVTARGTDINLIPQYAMPRRMIRWAARRAAKSITVCEALRTSMIDLGISGDRVITLRNGVDLERFHPIDRIAQRQTLGLDGFTLLSVGYLIPRKAHDLIIEALPQMPDVRLLIAGDGPEHTNLVHLAAQMGVTNRVTFLGALPQTELRNYYGAVDAMVLASSREGWANVLLESMACGTPVVASNVWGTPEVVTAPEAGVLLPERTPQGIFAAVTQLRANYPSHAATRAYAERFSWDDTTNSLVDLFKGVAGQGLGRDLRA
jgi:teichuronic acid biosynthesis glycosyltransferase TuaC